MEIITSFFESELVQTGQLTYGTIILRLFLSFAAGFVLGLERKFRQHPVGLRTLILICESSTLLMMLSITMGGYKSDASRIAAQIISGIGFLGGGAIMRQGLNIKGLTSASIIWASAALGMAIGAGMYVSSACVLTISILSLIILEKFEARHFPAVQSKHLLLVFNSNMIDFRTVQTIVEKYGIVVVTLDASKKMSEQQIRLTYSIKAPDQVNILKLAESLKDAGNLEEIALTD